MNIPDFLEKYFSEQENLKKCTTVRLLFCHSFVFFVFCMFPAYQYKSNLLKGGYTMFRNMYKELINAIVDDVNEEDKLGIPEFVDSRIEYMPEYVQAVYEHVLTGDKSLILLNKGMITTEEYQYRVKTADSNRRSKHDAMLSAMDQLNRLCDRYGIEKICPENPDRHVRANFAGAVTIECFLEGIHTPSEVIEEIYSKIYSPDDVNVDLSVHELKQNNATINRNKLKEDYEKR